MDDIIESLLGKRSIESARRQMDFNVTKYKEFIDLV